MKSLLRKKKNIVVTCLYRTPGSNIDIFNQNLDYLFDSLNNKVHFVCGDLNIDLLNPQGNTKTTDFINTMYSNSLFQVITKPSRITLETATLIDHIFTNTTDNDVTARLLLSDFSVHLPIFGIFQQLLKSENRTSKQCHKFTRYRTPQALTALKADLSTQTWDEVYITTDPDQAYEAFSSTLLKLYDEHCPLTESPSNNKNRNHKPWITKGLDNACKKKNRLYKLYMKQNQRS